MLGTSLTEDRMSSASVVCGFTELGNQQSAAATAARPWKMQKMQLTGGTEGSLNMEVLTLWWERKVKEAGQKGEQIFLQHMSVQM